MGKSNILDIAKTTKQLTEGNELALREIIDLFSPDLYVFALGFVKRKEIAEEIISDVFVKIWEDRLLLTQIISIKCYLHILVKNKAISHLRSAKNNSFISIDSIENYHISHFHATDTESLDKEKLVAVNTAIDKLPPRCKMVFTLAKVNGLKYKEIAEIMDISVKTIDNQIAYALEKIWGSLNMPSKRSKKQINQLLSALILVV